MEWGMAAIPARAALKRMGVYLQGSTFGVPYWQDQVGKVPFEGQLAGAVQNGQIAGGKQACSGRPASKIPERHLSFCRSVTAENRSASHQLLARLRAFFRRVCLWLRARGILCSSCLPALAAVTSIWESHSAHHPSDMRLKWSSVV